MSSYFQSPFFQEDASACAAAVPNAQSSSTTRKASTSASSAFKVDAEPASQSKSGTKKRRPSGNSQVKHRRTRNGCYTCRGRRVKCDEQHPVCERCRKGNRDCTYPEHRPAPKSTNSSRQDPSHHESPVSESSLSEDEDGKDVVLQTQESQRQTFRSKEGHSDGIEEIRASVETSPLDAHFPITGAISAKIEGSRSPSTELNSGQSSSIFDQRPPSSSRSTEASHETTPGWSHLPDDLQFYLQYHQSNVSFHHYFFKHDANHFLHVHLIEQALLFEPLLHAVAGFAAFQYTVKRGHGHILDFLEYYNKSVSLLRRSLANGEPHTDGTMLTVLQLATFEEYLGDWVSLLSHQQAAYRMLVELYDTNSILDSELRRRILEWYLRFDITGSIMSGNETAASREWFSAIADYYDDMASKYPNDIDFKIEAAIGVHRVTCVDMAMMFARFSKGVIPIEEFKRHCEDFTEDLNTWRDKLDPVFSDDKHRVWTFDNKFKAHDDIVDPYQAGGLFNGPLATFNFMQADWLAILAMFCYKKALTLGEPPPLELPEWALELCRVFEAIEFSPEFPPEAILKAQGILGVASLFLPKDERHTMWCRRKLAKIEGLGHIYPNTFRRRMAALWNLPEINHWWLPNEEAYPSVARSVRSVLDNRNGDLDTRQRSQDQRDMRGIFSNLRIKDEGYHET